MSLTELTKVTGPGIHTLSNVLSHNIKSSGIITATKFVGPVEGAITATDATFSGNVSIAGTLTYEDVTNIDSVGIITAPAVDVDDFVSVGSNIHLGNAGVITATSFVGSGAALTGIDATAIKDSGGNVKVQAQASGAMYTGIHTFSSGAEVGSNIKLGNAGVITATSFVGDGSDLTNLPAGLGTALSATASNPLNKMYYTNQVLGVPSSVTVDVPASASKAYTQYADIKVDGSADLIIAEGDDLIPDVLGLADFGTFGGGASAGRIRVNSISNAANDGSPTVQKGLVITGVTTATTFSGSGASLTNLPAANLTGTLPAISGANLTSLPAQATIANNADNRVITGGSGVNLNGEANLTFNGNNVTLEEGRLFVKRTTIPSVDVRNSTNTSYSRVILQQGAAEGGYFQISREGTNSTAGAGANSVELNQSSNHPLTIKTNNTERLRITGAGNVAIGRDAALNNYAAGSTTTQLAVVKDGGAAGSGYHEVAHFTGGTDTDDTGAIVRITQFNNDRGLYIKGGRGTGDQAKAIFGLRNSSNSDNDVMVFHQGGNVTKPSEVGFHATGTSTYTHSSNFVPEFNTEYFDIGGGYNNSNYRFTAPVAGRYFFYYQYLTYPDADPTYKTFLLRKNGSNSAYDHGFYRGREGTHGNQASQQMSTYIQLAENDYIEAWVELGSQGSNYKNYMGSGHSHFWGYLVH